MGLTSAVVTQFAKITNDTKKEKEPASVYGTVVRQGDDLYVQMDGSNLLTPVESTTDMKAGDRVTVTIKNHTATATGNLTSPAARTGDVQELGDSVELQNATIGALNSSVTIIESSVRAQDSEISNINSTVQNLNSEVSNINSTVSSINSDIEVIGGDLTSVNDRIDTAENNITAANNRIDATNNAVSAANTSINTANDNITAANNRISAAENNITANGNSIQILNSGFTIQNGVITGLDSAVIRELISNTIVTETLDADYIQAGFANIGTAEIEKLFSESGMIENLVVGDQTITGELVGVTISGDLIKGNTIKADKLVVRGSDGLYYKLNIDGLNNISTDLESKFVELISKPSDWETNYKDYYEISNDSYIHISSNTPPTWALNTYYKLDSEHESGLDGSVIIAKSITATKISVDDLVAFDATIGGFDITNESINSHLKPTLDESTPGVYLQSDGQIAIGDNDNYLKFYKDYNVSEDSENEFVWKFEIDTDNFRIINDTTANELLNVNDTLDDINNKILDSADTMASIESGVEELKASVSDLSGENGIISVDPGAGTITLGNKENNFKVRITNTEMDFMSGDETPAYIGNEVDDGGNLVESRLFIEKATVKNELKNGDHFTWLIDSNGNLGLVYK